MPYRLSDTPNGVEAELTAATHHELFREVINATLDVAYSGQPALGAYEGQVVPVQAAGGSLPELIAELSRDCLQAARESTGTLHTPKWMSFDEARVTATLPLTLSVAGPGAGRVSVRSAVALAGKSAPLAFLVDFQRAAEHH